MFSKPWDDDPTKGMILVEESVWDDEDPIRVEYDRTYFFPLTRWLQEQRGERVTHELHEEFCHLAAEVSGEFLKSLDFSSEAWDTSNAILHPCENAMLALWDVRGVLMPWIVREMITTLVGSGASHDLPEPPVEAFNREQEYRGGPSNFEKLLANLDHRVMLQNDDIPYPDV